MHKERRSFVVAVGLLLTFLLFTLTVLCVDVRPIGPEGSGVGLATLNLMVSERLGVNMTWYAVTDWLALIPIAFACCFAALGLGQLAHRGGLRRVDPDILWLGLFYLVVIGFYALFERFVVNYRPVLLDGGLEASYPSSHVMVVLCVTATAMTQFHRRLGNARLRRALDAMCVLIMAVTVLGRLASGVHWFTDILGGLILSAALVTLYRAATARA